MYNSYIWVLLSFMQEKLLASRNILPLLSVGKNDPVMILQWMAFPAIKISIGYGLIECLLYCFGFPTAFLLWALRQWMRFLLKLGLPNDTQFHGEADQCGPKSKLVGNPIYSKRRSIVSIVLTFSFCVSGMVMMVSGPRLPYELVPRNRLWKCSLPLQFQKRGWSWARDVLTQTKKPALMTGEEYTTLTNHQHGKGRISFGLV